MTNIFSTEKPNRNIDYLAPSFKLKIKEFLKEAWQDDELKNIRVFEGYRSPLRQNHLYELGRTKPGKIVTNKSALQSWHQFGLAVDMAFLFPDRRWGWNGNWEKLIEIGNNHGFRNLSPFEKAHFEFKHAKLSLKQAQDIYLAEGIISLWEHVLTLD